MKIRRDFITNSSSSSYCIFGIDVSNAIELLKTVKEGTEEYEDQYVGEALDTRLAQSNIEYVHDSEGGCLYLGISPQNFDRDKTIAQIEAEIQATIKKLFPELKFEDRSVTWHDGVIAC